MSSFEQFIHEQNLALFKRRLADPGIGPAERKVLLKLLAEEEMKDQAPQVERELGGSISANGKGFPESPP